MSTELVDPKHNSTALVDQEGQHKQIDVLRAGSHTASHAIQLAAAILDTRIATAKQFPRSISRFKSECRSLLTEDVETARSAEYAKPVGGGTVRGPSIRLLELAGMCWGNLELTIDDPIVNERSVTVTASAWDLERNYRAPGIATSSILTKFGVRYPQHLIETTIAACASKARRNAIAAVIPKAYVNYLLGEAKEVARANAKPISERRIDAIGYFQRSGVSLEQILSELKIIGQDDIGEDQLDELNAIRIAIRDEGGKAADFFPPPSELKSRKKPHAGPAATSPPLDVVAHVTELLSAANTLAACEKIRMVSLAEFDIKWTTEIDRLVDDRCNAIVSPE